MRRRTVIALIAGVAALAATVIYAGAGAVVHAIASLRLSGLLLLVLVHVPMVALMGCAWRLASGSEPPASVWRFVWARFVRDAASELLPFLQLGGVVFGVRALGRGRAVIVGAVSAGIDGVIELAAKVPYSLIALLALLALAPQSPLTRPLSLALAATASFVNFILSPLVHHGPKRGPLEPLWNSCTTEWGAVVHWLGHTTDHQRARQNPNW